MRAHIIFLIQYLTRSLSSSLVYYTCVTVCDLCPVCVTVKLKIHKPLRVGFWDVAPRAAEIRARIAAEGEDPLRQTL